MIDSYLAHLDDMFIGLWFIGGTLDEEDETHGRLIVLRHEHGLEIGVSELAHHHGRRPLDSQVLVESLLYLMNARVH